MNMAGIIKGYSVIFDAIATGQSSTNAARDQLCNEMQIKGRLCWSKISLEDDCDENHGSSPLHFFSKGVF
jgi:hypothetical protein